MASKEMIQARVPRDMLEALEEYEEEKEVTKTDAIRRALHKEYMANESGEDTDQPALRLPILNLLTLLLGASVLGGLAVVVGLLPVATGLPFAFASFFTGTVGALVYKIAASREWI